MRMPVCKLKLGTSGRFQIITQALIDVCPQDDHSVTPFVPLGRARVKVVPTDGLVVKENGRKCSHFIPWFTRHGVFEGLAVASAHGPETDEVSILVLIEVEHEELSLGHVRSTTSFSGCYLRGTCGKIVASVAILGKNEDLHIEVDGRTHGFVFRDGTVIATH